MKIVELDVFNRNGEFLRKKRIYAYDNNTKSINQWISSFGNETQNIIGWLGGGAPDFQNQKYLCILNKRGNRMVPYIAINANNLIQSCIYLAVRHCIPATWLNDRDQFLYPYEPTNSHSENVSPKNPKDSTRASSVSTKLQNDKLLYWAHDSEFQSNCLAFMLFHGQNRITSKEGMNHFIPFGEKEVGAKEAFQSHFMCNFINGKIKHDSTHPLAPSAKEGEKDKNPTPYANKEYNGNGQILFETETENLIPTKPLKFSEEAQEVLNTGLVLWRYYHAQEFRDSKNPYNPNASLYDIKAYFQGFNANGRMNPPQKAEDLYYKDCIGNLNNALDNLAKKIEPKVYQYGFLLD